MWLSLIILLPFLGSLCVAFLPSNTKNWEAWLAGAVAAACTFITLMAYPTIAKGEVLAWQHAWLPSYGLNFSLRMDGFAWLFSLLVSGIGILVVLYARYYLSEKDPIPRFFAFLLAFMGAMLGIVLSGNIIQMALFWELTSLVSFMLIGYWHHRADARRGARMSLIVTATGGLCLLVGLVLMGQAVGSYELGHILSSGDTLREHPWYLAILLLVALGALTKSAQFPFHFWLPRAMAAPTPVSAYLHSATMVKAGVFLLMRFWPVLAGTEAWSYLIGFAGLITLVMGAFVAIFQQDLKGLLAYSTISHLGLITLLLGMGTPLAAVAALLHVLNHATFKASLFMAAGIIDHESGTRDLRELTGLRKLMPITATLAMVAAAAMAGVPLLNGFLSKEMFFAEAAGFGSGNTWLPTLAVLAGALSVVYSLRFITEVFFGPPPSGELPKTPKEPPRWMRFPIEMLVVLCIVVGTLPGVTVAPALNLAVHHMLGAYTPEYSVQIWHGFNLPLLMSVLAFGFGLLLYFLLQRRYGISRLDKVPLLHRLDGQREFERILLAVTSFAVRVEEKLTSERLQPQLFWLFVVTFVVGALTVWRSPIEAVRSPIGFEPMFAVLWIVGGVCAVAAAYQAKHHRLAALILMSATGIVVSLTFALFSAPDLALTQAAVEVVTTVLILLGLRWLPRRLTPDITGVKTTWRDYRRRLRDGVLAVAIGVGMAAVTYLVLLSAGPTKLTDFFIQHALPEGGGTNVVNVILVDFRGFDTFGEITVLGVVALTIYALLRRFRPAPESIEIPAQRLGSVKNVAPWQLTRRGYLALPAIYFRALMPVLVMLALYFLYRGHNEPGGGFVAGLILTVALMLQYMVSGTLWIEAKLRIRPHQWLGTGILLALVTGAGAWWFGFPFLTSHTAVMQLPVLGEMHFPSAFLFDLGVFALVVGASSLLLIALAHQSLRSHRKHFSGKPKTPRKRGAMRWS